jgi:hypothetical protein
LRPSEAADVEILTERHLLLFGTIVHWFARYERLMADIMAGLTGADSVSVELMTGRLSFEDKGRALLNILRYRKVPLDQYDRVCGYLRLPEELSALRDNIVHSTWSASRIPKSIQPDWVLRPPSTVQPWLGGIDAVFIKAKEEKIGYTVEELAETARSLSLNFEAFAGYAKEIRPTAQT